ncbi:MAG: M50 family metallopeptidase [Alphaproteobacteria bacterium]|nr:M50 family metallopeptidase [Alphaproteobacteria bacterium]
MRRFVNPFLSALRYPLAAAMLVCLVPAFLLDIAVVKSCLNSFLLLWFFLPLMIVVVVWFLIPGLNGSFLAILEHELTHMLFAVLTGHKPGSIAVHQGRGGSFAFEGKGNWLIFLSPYFFPTFAFAVMLAGGVYHLWDAPLPKLYWSVLGVMSGYHIASNIMEIHPKQTDFKKAGYLFSFLFLPSANLIAWGVLFMYARFGWPGIGLYFSKLAGMTGAFIQQFA